MKNVALHRKRRAKTRCRRGRRWKIFWRKMHWTWIQDDDDGHLQTDVKALQVKCEELMEKQQRLGRKIRETSSSRAKKVDKLERKVKQLEETYFYHNFQKWKKKELKERTKQPKRTAGSSTPIKLFISANWRGERRVLRVKRRKWPVSSKLCIGKVKKLKIKVELSEKVQRWKKVEKKREVEPRSKMGKK